MAIYSFKKASREGTHPLLSHDKAPSKLELAIYTPERRQKYSSIWCNRYRSDQKHSTEEQLHDLVATADSFHETAGKHDTKKLKKRLQNLYHSWVGGFGGGELYASR